MPSTTRSQGLWYRLHHWIQCRPPPPPPLPRDSDSQTGKSGSAKLYCTARSKFIPVMALPNPGGAETHQPSKNTLIQAPQTADTLGRNWLSTVRQLIAHPKQMTEKTVCVQDVGCVALGYNEFKRFASAARGYTRNLSPTSATAVNQVFVTVQAEGQPEQRAAHPTQPKACLHDA